MNNNEEDPGGCVDKVSEDTQRHLMSLLDESATAPSIVRALESENETLREQARALREELDRQQSQKDQLLRRLADVESSMQELLCQYLDSQQQNNNLANLYVASDRLHGSLNRQEGLDVIQEIIINLIGSEELAIFEVEKDSVLSLMSSFGIDPGQYQTIPVGAGVIGSTALSGESYLAGRTEVEGRRPDELELTACVPLRLNGKVWGVIAIFRLLQQKSGFETADYELLELLATQAAIAIHRAGPDEVGAESEVS